MLDMLGITALINVSANCPNHFEDSFLYKSIPVEDNHKADISSWFNEAIEFIGEHIGMFHLLPSALPRPPNVKQPVTAVAKPIDDTDIRPIPLPSPQPSPLSLPDLNFKKFPPKPTSWFGTGFPLLDNSGDIITTSQPLNKGRPSSALFSPKLVLFWVDWLRLNGSPHAALCSN